MNEGSLPAVLRVGCIEGSLPAVLMHRTTTSNIQHPQHPRERSGRVGQVMELNLSKTYDERTLGRQLVQAVLVISESVHNDLLI